MGEVGEDEGDCFGNEVSIGIIGVDCLCRERATRNRSRGAVGAKLTLAQGHLAPEWLKVIDAEARDLIGRMPIQSRMRKRWRWLISLRIGQIPTHYAAALSTCQLHIQREDHW